MNRYWQTLSARERRLALITGGLVAVSVILLSARAALSHLDDQAYQIAQLEQHLVNLMEQDSRRFSVEQAFSRVAAQHSSEWTEEEIHDRLRREIYRLALKEPHEPGQVPPGGLTRRDYMVVVPVLREGTLTEEGDGYREYQIRFQVATSGLADVVRFLERLELSDQSLRIDELELTRAPSGQFVNTSLTVTRTVVDGVPPELEMTMENLIENGGFDAWDGAEFSGWEHENCRVGLTKAYSTTKGTAMRAEAADDGAVVYQTLELEAGQSYRLLADITVDGSARLGVVEATTGDAYAGAQELTNDGQTYRYDMEFTVAGAEGSMARLRVPFVTLTEAGNVVYIDNVRLYRLRLWKGTDRQA